MKFLGRTFLPARKARKISGRISGRISEQISETSFQISRLFFGNFVQQKGGANYSLSFFLRIVVSAKMRRPACHAPARLTRKTHARVCVRLGRGCPVRALFLEKSISVPLKCVKNGFLPMS